MGHTSMSTRSGGIGTEGDELVDVKVTCRKLETFNAEHHVIELKLTHQRKKV